MRLRPLVLSLLAAVVVSSALLVAGPVAETGAQVVVAPEDEVVALELDGIGFGHGRGLSQWGSFGWSVNHGHGWQQILNHYYGGTQSGTVEVNRRIRVRLLGHDNRTVVGVVSTGADAMWAGIGYAALQVRETAPNTFAVYSAATRVCPSSSLTGWTLRASNLADPVTLQTSVNEVTAPAGEVLGLCGADGSVVHYRGRLQVVEDSTGANRVVNDLPLESYLRGVVSREVSTSWGNAGGGAGMNALRAQSVAARSYAVSQNRYPFAQTCDTTACQAYGGAARRASASAPIASGGVCEAGNATFECANTNQAVLDTARTVRKWPATGAVVATEFAASNGPRTAGGAFPAVDDPADDVPANPNHRWTRVLDAHAVASTLGIGPITAATSEPDPNLNFDGLWDQRVRLSGSTIVTNAILRTTFGLRSSGFTVRAVTRGEVTASRMALIGDSVGASVTESSTAELPALLDGVFGATRYDAVVNRCTAGCPLSGVAAAASVPVGTALVVVELGYNDSATNYAARIDELMTALRGRSVGRVVWVNLSQRSPTSGAAYTAINQALTAAAGRWPELRLVDWRSASAGHAHNEDRWFAPDGVHLTPTGQAEFALFLKTALAPFIGPPPPGERVPAGSTLRVPVLGVGGVPSSGVEAVVWNVTVLSPAASGWATVWPCGLPRPGTSNVVFEAGEYESTAVLVAPGTGGEVCVFTSAAAHVVVDVNGWVSAGFESLAARRIVDTRRTGGRLGAGETRAVDVLGVGGVPSSGVEAVVWNVTVLSPAASGWATVWPCGLPRPGTSNVVFEAGEYESTAVLVAPGTGGEVCVFTSAAAHVVVDVNGWVSAGFESLAARRIVDTRRTGGRLGAGETRAVDVLGVGGVPSSGVEAVVWNVTVLSPAASGWATVWPCGLPRPGTSNVVFEAGEYESTAVLVAPGTGGEVCVFTSAAAHVVVDVNGWVSAGFESLAARRIVDTRRGLGYVLA